ncbi:unnamed protein product [Citrullus colocynthis]|uniref:Uncharacterized protein n=1 Tax=Citrullus colocynthis TaxID=252529 RepID=A0ABP0Z265_9ROSI
MGTGQKTTRCKYGTHAATVGTAWLWCSQVVLSQLCSVEFNPYDGKLVAVGCANQKAYRDDQYKMGEPIVVSEGHEKTVMYVKFMDRRTMVSTRTKGGTIVSTRRKRKMVEKHC